MPRDNVLISVRELWYTNKEGVAHLVRRHECCVILTDLMLPGPGICWVSADTTLSLVKAKLPLEAATIALVIVEIRGIVKAQPPHGGSGGRLHETGMTLHFGNLDSTTFHLGLK